MINEIFLIAHILLPNGDTSDAIARQVFETEEACYEAAPDMMAELYAIENEATPGVKLSYRCTGEISDELRKALEMDKKMDKLLEEHMKGRKS